MARVWLEAEVLCDLIYHAGFQPFTGHDLDDYD